MKKLGFIGGGNIATAIIKGAVATGIVKPTAITVFDIDEKKLAPFTTLGCFTAKSLGDLANNSDIIFLTVKPQVLENVLNELKEVIAENTLIISPVAGAKTSKISALLGSEKIIRVMPNTPLMYGAGATAITAGAEVTKDELDFAKKVFSALGVTATVDEDKMDTVTAISGSSPAFFMRFAKEIIDEGVRQGMDQKTAKDLVLATMAGSAKMAAQSESSLDELIKAVASPGGTTEAGLNKMDNLDFDNTTAEVIKAAANRSKEL